MVIVGQLKVQSAFKKVRLQQFPEYTSGYGTTGIGKGKVFHSQHNSLTALRL